MEGVSGVLDTLFVLVKMTRTFFNLKWDGRSIILISILHGLKMGYYLLKIKDGILTFTRDVFCRYKSKCLYKYRMQYLYIERTGNGCLPSGDMEVEVGLRAESKREIAIRRSQRFHRVFPISLSQKVERFKERKTSVLPYLPFAAPAIIIPLV